MLSEPIDRNTARAFGYALLFKRIGKRHQPKLIHAAITGSLFCASVFAFPAASLAQSARGQTKTQVAIEVDQNTQRPLSLDSLQSASRRPMDLLRQLQLENRVADPDTPFPPDIPLAAQQLGNLLAESPAVANQIRNLSPAQQEQLRKLAEQFAGNAFPNGIPSTLPPGAEQLEKSLRENPELREMARKFAEANPDLVKKFGDSQREKALQNSQENDSAQPSDPLRPNEPTRSDSQNSKDDGNRKPLPPKDANSSQARPNRQPGAASPGNTADRDTRTAESDSVSRGNEGDNNSASTNPALENQAATRGTASESALPPRTKSIPGSQQLNSQDTARDLRSPNRELDGNANGNQTPPGVTPSGPQSESPFGSEEDFLLNPPASATTSAPATTPGSQTGRQGEISRQQSARPRAERSQATQSGTSSSQTSGSDTSTSERKPVDLESLKRLQKQLANQGGATGANQGATKLGGESQATNRANQLPSSSPRTNSVRSSTTGASSTEETSITQSVAQNPKSTDSPEPESAMASLQKQFEALGVRGFLKRLAKETAGMAPPKLQQQSANKDSELIAQNRKPAEPKSSDTKSKSTPPSSREQSTSSNSLNGENAATNSPSIFSGWNNSKPKISNNAPPPAPKSAPTFNDADQAEFTFPGIPSWIWVIPGVILALLGVLWFLPRSQQIMDQVSGKTAAIKAKEMAALGEIHSRSDAIAAFHWVLLRKLRGFEDWWTSRRVVQHLRGKKEPLQPAIEEAAKLYDLARYAPAEQPFTDRELERMRNAIQACATANTIG